MQLINHQKNIILTIIFCFLQSSANSEEIPTYIPIFSINEDIVRLNHQSEIKHLNTSLILKELNIDFNALNPAEQYLYFMIQANGAQGINKHNQIIAYLLQAKSLDAKINPDQLNNLPFINVHKKIAQSYAKTGQFKKAYDAKKIFIKKYDIFLMNEKNKHIFELENKYETTRKKNVTTILNNQTALKALEINESLNNEAAQRRNIYIVIIVAFAFLILLIRLFFVNKRISALSKEDMLTGVCNRKALFRHGKILIKNCVEQHTSLCLLAINIDNFKVLNDIHGDYVGDEVLKRFTSLGIESMRTRDVFARLEDATFIAVLPEASDDDAKAIAQHLKAKISAFNFDYIGVNEQLDINLSIVKLSETLNTFELLLNTAMNVIYEIKDSGGNQIKIYQP